MTAEIVPLGLQSPASAKRPIRVVSIPSGHPYVQHLGWPAGDARVVRLADPPVPGAPPSQWWPPRALDPAWVRRNADRFDVYHIHFGFESRSAAQLDDLVQTLTTIGHPLILTVHDLRNPHQPKPEAHDAALDILVPAAAVVITLTPGAAAAIRHRWSRDAVVIPHPHIVDLTELEGTRPVHEGFVVGLHAKSGRVNNAAVEVAWCLASEVAVLPGATLRVDVNDDAGGRELVRHLPDVDTRVHPRFTDPQFVTYLRQLDLSVLPYRFGTHSGWLEACYDVGTIAVAPSCGFFAQQAPCLVYELDESGLREDSLREAVRRGYEQRFHWKAGSAYRVAQREAIATTHYDLYRRALSAQQPGSSHE